MLKCKIFIEDVIQQKIIMSTITNNQFSSFTMPPVYDFTVGIGRDGVINHIVSPCVSNPDLFEPITNSIEAIALMRNKGYNIVITSNQSGVGQGYMSPADVDVINNKLLDLLGKAGCTSINGLYYSISGSKDDVYVKPNLGMFDRAKTEQRVNFKGGAVIGDDIADLKAAVKLGATPILVLTGNGEETLKQLNRYANKDLKKKTKVFNNLWEFAEAIPTQNL